jgi:alginate O-acetyltransferase complex protein AlgI
MIFNSISYLAFMLVAVPAYWLLPTQWRQSFVLVASLVFYGLWRVDFVFLVVFSAFVDYFFSLKIYEATEPRKRLLYVLLSVATNVGLLVYFKYTYFIIDNAAELVGIPDAQLRSFVGRIILPLGISFYTFLSISYTIDIYRRDFIPVRSFKLYLTYVMFWPHMIAGPILRAHELIPQFTNPRYFSVEDIDIGLRAILYGLFLKVGLADQLAPLIDQAFGMSPAQLGGVDVLTMAFGFGLQIYFDFAGYSMIAIGSARLLGVTFPNNFNWPYLATSPREFWRRWHITLSSWIRDYLYLPLSGLRERSHSTGGIDIQFVQTRNIARVTLALFLTWFVMGLWHGASWNFAFWGLWHAVFIFGYRITNEYFVIIPTWLSRFLGWGTTLVMVMLGWIFFRAPTLGAALTLYGRLFDVHNYATFAFRENFYLIVFAMMLGMLVLWWISATQLAVFNNMLMRAVGDIVGLVTVFFVVFIFLRPISQFIYFQF